MYDPDAYDPTRSVTEHERAIRFFTDREHARAVFSDYLNSDPPRRTILFFQGDGGNGKSLLLKWLSRHCYSGFQAGDTTPPAGAKVIPYAYLDFGLKKQDKGDPRDVVHGLKMLR